MLQYQQYIQMPEVLYERRREAYFDGDTLPEGRRGCANGGRGQAARAAGGTHGRRRQAPGRVGSADRTGGAAHATGLGGALCAIVGVVGILNFFNAILTGILVRKREFAMLQAVGMTGKQLKKMLVTEGLLYAGATVLLSLVLVFLLEPLVGGMLEDMFWFFAYHFDVTALWAAAPVFLLLGVVLPLGVYRGIARMTIVERLREVE